VSGRPEHPLAGDLDAVLEGTRGLWEELRGERLFITGGTGFFGKWLLESLAWAEARLGPGIRATVLTRDPALFGSREPALAAQPLFTFHAGDVRGFSFPQGEFSHVIHAATDASVADDPERTREIIASGTRRVLDFAAGPAAARRLLLVSSGAVYGRQPTDLPLLTEDHPAADEPLDARAAYGAGKRASEALAAEKASARLEIPIARGFAFVGPHLPLDSSFAIAQFIGDGLAGREIAIGGDGTPLRSYLYASDLAVWLWTILLKGQSLQAYNVGSEQAVTIREAAEAVAGAFTPAPSIRVARVADPAVPPSRYLPSTRRAREELGLAETVPLAEAVDRTVRWHGSRAK